MNLIRRVRSYRHSRLRKTDRSHVSDEPQLISRGWDKYAREWEPTKFRVLPGQDVQYLGDEWSVEDVSSGGTTYGLAMDETTNLGDYIRTRLLNPYLPSIADEGLEIGPGGGRLTALLLPGTKTLHLADPSEAMLQHLKRRFAGVHNLRYYHTDGMNLPALRPGSLDYVIAFDVFVHFEARLTFWYLRQIATLLKSGGTGIIHYANVLTTIGRRQFQWDLESNVRYRANFAAFGAMCPQLMSSFLEDLEFEVVSTDVGLIPRDAITVFRKPLGTN